MSKSALICTEATAGGIITPVSPSNPLPVVSTVVLSASSAATWVRGNKAPAATNTPEVLAVDGTYVQSVIIIAQRAARTANAASVWIDATGTNDAQQWELAPGQTIAFTAPPGKVIDLNDIYVDSGTLTDGVFYIGVR